MQIGHNVIDCDLHRVVVAPVVVKHSQCLAEIDVSVLNIAVHEMRLDHRAVELDRFCVEWRQVLVKDVQSHLSFFNRFDPLFLSESDFAHSEQSFYVISVARVLSKCALHVA